MSTPPPFARSARVLATLLLLLAVAPPPVHAHSFLLRPVPDWKSEHRAHCRRGGPNHEQPDDCPGPCIPWDSWFVNRSAPTTVWSRGQRVLVRWARNNHQTGFVRLALVPRAQRMSFVAHQRAAFHYACWDGNKRACDSNTTFCGTDVYSYQTTATVPTVPDGHYILGWTWYGGFGTDNGTRYNFADYWSCANIRIAGGAPVPSSPTPTLPAFVPGLPADSCMATTNRIGKCRVEPCDDSDVPHGPRRWRPYGFPAVLPTVTPHPHPTFTAAATPTHHSHRPHKNSASSHTRRSPTVTPTPRHAPTPSRTLRASQTPSTSPSHTPPAPRTPTQSPTLIVSQEQSPVQPQVQLTPRPAPTPPLAPTPSASYRRPHFTPTPHPSPCRCPPTIRRRSPYVYALQLVPLTELGRRASHGICLCDGSHINPTRYPHGFTIEALVHGRVTGARFFLDGHLVQFESYMPYAISENNDGIFVPYRVPHTRRPVVLAVDVRGVSGRFGGRWSARVLFVAGTQRSDVPGRDSSRREKKNHASR